MAQDFAKGFYNSYAWRKCRASYIKACGGLCEECLKSGIIKPGYELHHIEHLTPDNINDESVTLNYDNLIYLCKDCHSMQHSTRITPRRYNVDNITGTITIL